MKILDRLLSRFAPPPPPPNGNGRGHIHAQAVESTNGSGTGYTYNYFEALRQSPDRQPLSTGYSTIMAAGDRVSLSMIARAIYDNHPWVAYAVEQAAIYCSPVWPQANSPSNEWNLQAEEYFKRWAEHSDFYGREAVDFPAQQTLISQAIDIDGDIGCLAVLDGGAVRLKLIEGLQIATPGKLAGQETVVDGVQIDASKRVAGYHVVDVSAKDLGSFFGSLGAKSVFYDPSVMTLLRDVRLTETYRGLSPLRRGANHIRDGNDILRFAKLQWKDYTSLRGVIEGGFLDEEHGFDLTPPGDTTPPLAESTNVGRMDLLGGDVPVLPAGKVFKRLEGAAPSADVEPFLDSLAALFAAGMLLPPAFFLDSKLTGPNTRSVNGKAQRRFNQRRRLMARFVLWTWIRVVGNGIATGQLPNQIGWDVIGYQFPPDISIDAGDDAKADREDIEAGNKCRQEVTGKRGRDWQRVTDQIFAEDKYIIERCKQLSAETGIPVEILLQRHGIMPKPQAAPPILKEYSQDPEETDEEPQKESKPEPEKEEDEDEEE